MNKQENRLQRIARMEEIYDQGTAAVEQLLRALQRYADLSPALRELEMYYQSPVWMADFLADQAGEIPKDLKRGILTEDAIYDLLTDLDRLRKLLRLLEADGTIQKSGELPGD